MGRSTSEYHSFANIVADLSALREQYGTVLTLLRIYSLTKTVWVLIS
ncbi:protein of unknown function [Brochothrix thermosphacta]|nr:hypothetical protein BTH160X_70087 [Brochothrix thermosphacta]SPN71358.1 protein of unknown function [Brochothrix thermosphacta]